MYFDGIEAPSLNAALSRRSDLSTSPSGPSPSSAGPHATGRTAPASDSATTTTDLTTAAAIDWIVEGSTYGCYETIVSTNRISFHTRAESDIDGNAVKGCVYLNKATLDSAGGSAESPTMAACGSVTPTFGSPWGQVQDPTPTIF